MKISKNILKILLFSFEITRSFLQFDKKKYCLDNFKIVSPISNILLRFPYAHFCFNGKNNFQRYKLNSQIRQSFKLLWKSKLINFEYSHFYKKHLKNEIIEYYCKSKSNYEASRKPFPNFNSGVYSECNNPIKAPLVDYLLKGKPDGKWIQEVVKPPTKNEKKFKNSIPQLKIALHIHAFYPEILLEIIKRIPKNLEYRCDVFISCSKINDEQIIKDICAARRITAQVISFPNVGRDIAPLITGFRGQLKNYDIVGHVHTKKSIQSYNRQHIANWVNFLYSNLLSSPESRFPILDSIIQKFRFDSKVGLIYPADPNIYTSDSCAVEMKVVLNRLNISYTIPRYIEFPAGTMFWARREVLDPFFNLDLNWNDYPSEPLSLDGTMLHAIERVIPIVAHVKGYKTMLTYTPGVNF